MADDKPVSGDLASEMAQLQKQQQIIEGSDESPISLIREREVQISGRVLSAKREADEIIAAARKRSADVVAAAQAEVDSGRADHEIEGAIRAQTEADLLEVQRKAEVEAQELEKHIQQRKDDVVKMVVGAVTGR